MRWKEMTSVTTPPNERQRKGFVEHRPMTEEEKSVLRAASREMFLLKNQTPGFQEIWKNN